MKPKEPKPQDLPELIPCEFCGKLISPGRNRKRRFCNNAEKQAAYRERRDGPRNLVTVASERNN